MTESKSIEEALGAVAVDNTSSCDHDVAKLEMSLYYYKQQCQQLKNLVRQQQGLGYDFQPLYQQQQLQLRNQPSIQHATQSHSPNNKHNSNNERPEDRKSGKNPLIWADFCCVVLDFYYSVLVNVWKQSLGQL